MALPRLATKATIKRASRQARANATRLDGEALGDLKDIYEQASAELYSRIAALGDAGDGNIRLSSLQRARDEIDLVLSELMRVQRTALFERMRQVAEMGIAPVAEMLGADRIAGLVDSSVKAVRDFVAADGLQLSDRLWKVESGAREAVGQAVASAVIQGNSASEAAEEFLQRGVNVPADLRKKISGSNADRLARVAGEELMHSDGSAYDQARRVFRTEINRAHGTAYQAGIFEHPDVVGTRFLLSPAHPEIDVCDMHATANRYGLGPGVYPKGKSPWPAHPNTLSYEEAVFADEVSEQDRAGQEDLVDWLKRQPVDVQVGVLGSSRKQQALLAGVLHRNEIKTPWYILKQRYIKRGVNVDDLKPEPRILPETKTASVGELDFGRVSADFNRLARRAFEPAPNVIKSVIGNMRKIREFHFTRGTAYCTTRGITLDLDDLKPGKEAWADDVTRHEYGHWIDFHGDHDGLKREGSFLSSTPSSEGGLGTSMKAAMRYLLEIKGEPRGEIHMHLIKSRDIVLADFFGALTVNRIGWGHSDSYYRRKGFRETEAFANLVCMYSRKDKSAWNYVRSVVPQLCDDFEDMLTRLAR